MVNRSEILTRICTSLALGNREEASLIARSEYGFEKCTVSGRKYTELESTQIFIRDGFVDRYSGERLVFPAALRLLSRLMPEEFPAHPNWKMSESHLVYWELFPTIDHVIPVARGGPDSEINWVTTSMIRNSAKSNWTLDELGWHMLPAGDFGIWDGLVGWFLQYVENEPVHLHDAYLRRWHKAAVRSISTLK